MSITHQTIRFLFLGAVAATLASCSNPPPPEEVVVHHTYHHNTVQHSTAPTDYGVVNQYDRQSR
jgi:hypothetical protein